MIIVIGNGFMGNIVAEYFNCPIWPKRIETLEDAKEACEGKDVVINCAGYTDVDGCEINKEKALKENVILPMLLNVNAKYLVHFSTGCMKNGEISPNDEIVPESFYAYTKLKSEKFADLVVRIRLPFGSMEHPKELITKIKNFKQANYTNQSLTCIDDMLPVLYELIAYRRRGIYHLVNEWQTSIYEIASMMGKKLERVSRTKGRVSTVLKYPYIKLDVNCSLKRILERRGYGAI